METKIITIANEKGGIGKTTTALCFADELQRRGYNVLLVDVDPQGNLSFIADADTNTRPVIADVFANRTQPGNAIQKTDTGFYIIPSDFQTAEYNKMRPDTLKRALQPVKEKYNYIVIDTPPTLSGMTLNAFYASDSCIIPTSANVLSIQGITKIANTVKAINAKLIIDGILLCKFSNHSIIHRQMKEQIQRIAEAMQTRLFNTTIRTAIAVEEAQTMQTPLQAYNKTANVTNDYKRFADEYLSIFEVKK